MQSPLVSVVMGVRNGEANLKDTINSILGQEGVNLEFIIVDDGSTDMTLPILKDIAKQDSRIKLISRAASGLTASLIEGCKVAKGKYIARQDANDISLPGRLKIQANTMQENKNASLCSTYVRFLTKEKVTVLVSCPEKKTDSRGLKGIIHGSVMMRRDCYHKVGGYRDMFYYAQDVDLWTRLVEIGEQVVVPDIYYEGLIFSDSISGLRKKEQETFFRYIRGATKARREGKTEDHWLNLAKSYSTHCKSLSKGTHRNANGAYFIGACLSQNNPTLARKYLGQALQINPRHLRARLKLATLKK